MAPQIYDIAILVLLACDACAGTAFRDNAIGETRRQHELSFKDRSTSCELFRTMFQPDGTSDEDVQAELAKIHVYWVPKISNQPLEFRESVLFAASSSSLDVEIVVDGAVQGLHSLESQSSDLWGGAGWAAISGDGWAPASGNVDVTNSMSSSDTTAYSTTAIVMLNCPGTASGEWFRERVGK